jgi:hypothetical protein
MLFLVISEPRPEAPSSTAEDRTGALGLCQGWAGSSGAVRCAVERGTTPVAERMAGNHSGALRGACADRSRGCTRLSAGGRYGSLNCMSSSTSVAPGAENAICSRPARPARQSITSSRNQVMFLRRMNDGGRVRGGRLRRHDSGRCAWRRRSRLRVNTPGETNEYERQQQYEAHANSLPRLDTQTDNSLPRQTVCTPW